MILDVETSFQKGIETWFQIVGIAFMICRIQKYINVMLQVA